MSGWDDHLPLNQWQKSSVGRHFCHVSTEGEKQQKFRDKESAATQAFMTTGPFKLKTVHDFGQRMWEDTGVP